MKLVCTRTQRVIADDVEVARTRAERNRGLLGRASLAASSALLLEPCFSVHTAFMQFPIDVVFVAGDGRAVKIVPRLQPWRLALSLKARTVIELPPGAAERHGIQVGDSLSLC
jgi:uncharacterized protein